MKSIKCYALLIFIAILTIAASFSQCVKMSKSYSPTRMEEYVAYCALWRTDATFQSTIRISNQLAVSEIDVTPTIYMEDGTAWDLPPVHLANSGTSIVDISASLRLHLRSALRA
jgi:hypothetical protein